MGPRHWRRKPQRHDQLRPPLRQGQAQPAPLCARIHAAHALHEAAQVVRGQAHHRRRLLKTDELARARAARAPRAGGVFRPLRAHEQNPPSQKGRLQARRRSARLARKRLRALLGLFQRAHLLDAQGGRAALAAGGDARDRGRVRAHRACARAAARARARARARAARAPAPAPERKRVSNICEMDESDDDAPPPPAPAPAPAAAAPPRPASRGGTPPPFMDPPPRRAVVPRFVPYAKPARGFQQGLQESEGMRNMVAFAASPECNVKANTSSCYIGLARRDEANNWAFADDRERNARESNKWRSARSFFDRAQAWARERAQRADAIRAPTPSRPRLRPRPRRCRPSSPETPCRSGAPDRRSRPSRT